MHAAAWSLHDALFELARERGLRSFHVECKQGPEGETVISLVLNAAERPRAPLPPPRGAGR